MKNLMTLLLEIICVFYIVSVFNNFTNSLPIPFAQTIQENKLLTEISDDLKFLNAPQEKIAKLANSVYVAHQVTGCDPKLVLALMKTESNFDEKAVGPKNRTKIRYKGILQTPVSTNFIDVDILHGIRILEEKMKTSKNNLQLALALYKGGDNNVAHKQANDVIKIYKNLKNKSNM